MDKYRELYDLYMKCLPQFPVTYDTFLQTLRPDAVHVLEHREGGTLIGFALLCGGSMSMLCVDPAYRNRGVGEMLLYRGEGVTQTEDNPRMYLGQGRHYLLQGVPEGPAIGFFSRRGYTSCWSSINMELPLNGFSLGGIDIPPAPQGLGFRFAEEADRPALLLAVKAAESKWVSIFEDCSDPVLLAELGGEVAGFEILSADGGYFVSPGERVGSIGCVGVVPDMRQRGIGLAMVAEGALWLKNQRCDKVELRYTWLEEWYGKLGFRTTCRQWMGEKVLSRW